jgi:hypothetical protein
MAHSCGARHRVLVPLRPGGVRHPQWVIFPLCVARES